jgi:hypothetical protein
LIVKKEELAEETREAAVTDIGGHSSGRESQLHSPSGSPQRNAESEASPVRELVQRKPRTVLEPDDSTDFSEIEEQVRNWTIRLRRKAKSMGCRAAKVVAESRAERAASSSAVGAATEETAR